MVWQPTMRVWAGDEVKVDEKELEGDAMDLDSAGPLGKASATESLRSQSMSVSAMDDD